MPSRHFRAHQRFAVRIPVTLTCAQRSVRADGESVDLGIGGGAFELDTPLRLGEEVMVRFEGEPACSVPAEVAWVAWAESSAVRVGVRFRPESLETLTALLEILGVLSDVGT